MPVLMMVGEKPELPRIPTPQPPQPVKGGLRFSHTPISSGSEQLRMRCSVATIQSDPEGHFSNLVDRLREEPSLVGEYEAALGQLSGLDPAGLAADRHNLEKIRIASGLSGLALFCPRAVFKAKDAEAAAKHRSEGNEHFQRGRLKEAFQSYSLAVIKAPYPSEEAVAGAGEEASLLAVALGNRSACLFSSGDFAEAAADINFALSLGYPAATRYKLYERLGRCHLKLGNALKARPAFMIVKQLLQGDPPEGHALPKEKRSALLNSTEKLLTECQGAPGPAFPATRGQNGPTTMVAQGLSSKVAIVRDSLVGQHAVAKETLLPGEVVLREEPCAAALYPEKLGFNCTHCFKRMKAAIPCHTCSGVGFCSTACRDQAEGSYHKYECRFQEVLTGLGCSQVARLALRLVTQESYQDLLKLRLPGEEGPETLRAVSRLVELNEQRWPEENLLRAIMALCLLSILRASGYFGDGETAAAAAAAGGGADSAAPAGTADGRSFSPNQLFVGSLLLKYMQVLQFNAHEVYETLRSNEHSIRPFKNVPVGLAVYPTASFLNHSCHAGVARSFRGKEMTLRALHPIGPEQEVAENYGHAFYLEPKEVRQAALEARYWFRCSCQACREGWPLLNELPSEANREKVTGAATSPAAASPEVAEFERAMGLMDQGEAEQASECLARCITLLYSCRASKGCVMMTEGLVRAEDKLRSCISNMGNVTFLKPPQK